MSFILIYQGEAGGHADHTQRGSYLKTADVNANDGHGIVTWSRYDWQAMKFDTFAAAAAFWNQQSTKRPLRDDGRPNKPLTAFTVEIRQLLD